MAIKKEISAERLDKEIQEYEVNNNLRFNKHTEEIEALQRESTAIREQVKKDSQRISALEEQVKMCLEAKQNGRKNKQE
jgi:hypothetical protein